jgi:hypothetical protein
MRWLGRELARRGWLLRSGGSPGADAAFEEGCDDAHGRKEIFLPWGGFNGSESGLYNTPAEALTIAARYHRGLLARSHRIQCLRARNVCQVLGMTLNEPSDVVIAWTDGGLPAGGTATVLHIAAERRIPTINLGSPEYARLGRRALLAEVMVLGNERQRERRSFKPPGR